jgi:hypothetical protein
LDSAIEAYLRGFETDWRDAYPGINALTLMIVRDPPDPRAQELLPIVRYGVERKIARTPKADYWDQATLLELAVLGADGEAVRQSLGKALTAVREPWEPKTTARNLSLIRRSRAERHECFSEGDEAESKLRVKAGLSEQLD